ncbi:hypothetical protein [Luteibacter sp. CQ10]|uniref:hypothetical protein n=1 Tax=Luteibacter sp. CQ10 TaxID=2805821 RepID=UPI0034A59FB4
MSHHYLSPHELQNMEIKRKADAELDAMITEKNRAIVGDTKTYKGISYASMQDGLITCINLPPLSGLDGTFTRETTLKKIIDDLERLGQLPKNK